MRLALDTTGRTTSLALKSLSTSWNFAGEIKQVEEITPKILEGLDFLESNPSKIEEVIITLGPGSFTGVRLGIAFVRGFSFANPLKIYGISTFEALTFDKAREDFIVVLDSLRREHVYLQGFGEFKDLEPQLFLKEDLRQFGNKLILSNMEPLSSEFKNWETVSNLAKGMVENIPNSSLPLEPFYVYDPEYVRRSST